MLPVTCRAVSEVNFEAFTAAFNHAYSDYYTPVVMTPSSFHSLMERDDLSFDASVAALNGSAIVGTGLLGIRGTTGWIGGMGVVPEYRRQGIGREMMHHLLGRARENGLTEVTLEVIEANEGARALYHEMGFEPVRYLLILERNPTAPMPTIDPDYPIVKASAEGLLEHYDTFHDGPNPWQRARPSLVNLAPHMEGWAARRQDRTTGYTLGWADTIEVRLVDLAAMPGLDRVPVGRAMLAHLHSRYPRAYGVIYNVADDDPLLPAFQSTGYTLSFRQIEMRRAI